MNTNTNAMNYSMPPCELHCVEIPDDLQGILYGTHEEQDMATEELLNMLYAGLTLDNMKVYMEHPAQVYLDLSGALLGFNLEYEELLLDDEFMLLADRLYTNLAGGMYSFVPTEAPVTFFHELEWLLIREANRVVLCKGDVNITMQ